MNENETLRWPTNLDHAAIVARLVQAREAAEACNLTHIATLFAGIETQPKAQIATSVIAALDWLQDRREHAAITTQLEMVALNLKNLK